MSIKDNEKGFSLIEALVVLAVLLFLSGLSVPNYLQWHQNARYKGAARDIASILREARARAISTNRQHRVEFDIDNAGGLDNAIQEYRLTQGNRSSGSTNWNTVIRNWVGYPASVSTKQGAGANCNSTNDVNIQLNPDGTATPVGTTNICIINGVGGIQYNISVNATTGRVRIL
jgi:type IV fimbrial biogenesis protein FimT